jgi:hypothetical protein
MVGSSLNGAWYCIEFMTVCNLTPLIFIVTDRVNLVVTVGADKGTVAGGMSRSAARKESTVGEE